MPRGSWQVQWADPLLQYDRAGHREARTSASLLQRSRSQRCKPNGWVIAGHRASWWTAWESCHLDQMHRGCAKRSSESSGSNCYSGKMGCNWYSGKIKKTIYWLVVWNMNGLWLSIQLGISSSQLTFTNHHFFRGVGKSTQPPTRWCCGWWPNPYEDITNVMLQGGAPVATKSLSWCVHNSNFTMVFVGDISN